jgi:acetyl-CoA carboxylase biotin carboxyl carrier protein
MELSRIKALIDLLAASPLTELELSEGQERIRLSKATPAPGPVVPTSRPAHPAPPPPQAASVPTDDRTIIVAAPMFGVVHLSAAPGEEPFVSPGQPVKAGQTIFLVEAMKVFSAVAAEADAVVDAVLVADGEEVESGRPLARLARI